MKRCSRERALGSSCLRPGVLLMVSSNIIGAYSNSVETWVVTANTQQSAHRKRVDDADEPAQAK